jgi:hypothetical protein
VLDTMYLPLFIQKRVKNYRCLPIPPQQSASVW